MFFKKKEPKAAPSELPAEAGQDHAQQVAVPSRASSKFGSDLRPPNSQLDFGFHRAPDPYQPESYSSETYSPGSFSQDPVDSLYATSDAPLTDEMLAREFGSDFPELPGIYPSDASAEPAFMSDPLFHSDPLPDTPFQPEMMATDFNSMLGGTDIPQDSSVVNPFDNYDPMSDLTALGVEIPAEFGELMAGPPPPMEEFHPLADVSEPISTGIYEPASIPDFMAAEFGSDPLKMPGPIDGEPVDLSPGFSGPEYAPPEFSPMQDFTSELQTMAADGPPVLDFPVTDLSPQPEPASFDFGAASQDFGTVSQDLGPSDFSSDFPVMDLSPFSETEAEAASFGFGEPPSDFPAMDLGPLPAAETPFDFGTTESQPAPFDFGAPPSDFPAMDLGPLPAAETPFDFGTTEAQPAPFDFAAPPSDFPAMDLGPLPAAETPFDFGATEAQPAPFDFGAPPSDFPAMDLGPLPAAETPFDFGATEAQPAPFDFGASPADFPAMDPGPLPTAEEPAPFNFDAPLEEAPREEVPLAPFDFAVPAETVMPQPEVLSQGPTDEGFASFAENLEPPLETAFVNPDEINNLDAFTDLFTPIATDVTEPAAETSALDLPPLDFPMASAEDFPDFSAQDTSEEAATPDFLQPESFDSGFTQLQELTPDRSDEPVNLMEDSPVDTGPSPEEFMFENVDLPEDIQKELMAQSQPKPQTVTDDFWNHEAPGFEMPTTADAMGQFLDNVGANLYPNDLEADHFLGEERVADLYAADIAAVQTPAEIVSFNEPAMETSWQPDTSLEMQPGVFDQPFEPIEMPEAVPVAEEPVVLEFPSTPVLEEILPDSAESEISPGVPLDEMFQEESFKNVDEATLDQMIQEIMADEDLMPPGMAISEEEQPEEIFSEFEETPVYSLDASVNLQQENLHEAEPVQEITEENLQPAYYAEEDSVEEIVPLSQGTPQTLSNWDSPESSWGAADTFVASAPAQDEGIVLSSGPRSEFGVAQTSSRMPEYVETKLDPGPGAQPAPKSSFEVIGFTPMGGQANLFLAEMREGEQPAVYALMSQNLSAGEPVMQTLRLFRDNPLMDGKMVAVCIEGHAGSWELYSVRIGYWKAVLRKSQTSVVLESELS